MEKTKEEYQELLARANINLQIKNLELQKIDADFLIQKREIQNDAREDSATKADNIVILTAQKSVNIRRKNRDIADVLRNISLFEDAIAGFEE